MGYLKDIDIDNLNKEKNNMNLNKLRMHGFDNSYHIPFTKEYQLRCSQCKALSINGIPTHETGCINRKYDCKGCNNIIDYHGYCEDCQ